MADLSPRARRWLVRGIAAGAALIVLALVLAVVVHTPPVRRFVLRRAVSTLEDRFGIALAASALRYNLFALRVSLDGVSVASTSSRQSPFFAADSVEFVVPRSALLGRFVVDVVRANNARLTIVRRSDGRTNLPSGSGDEEGAPAELPIDRLAVPRLAVSFVDEAADMALTLPALSLDVGRETGLVQLRAPGSLRRGGIMTAITRLVGDAAFDGRTLNLARAAVTTDEIDLTLDGTLAVLVEEPRADLRFSGSGDIAGLARWGTAGQLPTGRVVFDGEVAAPFDAPSAIVRLHDSAMTFDPIEVSAVSATVAVDGERLAISELGASFAGGRVTGGGEVPFDGGVAQFTASWNDVDAGALVRTLAPDADVVPAARADGDASFRGPLADPLAWTVDVSTALAAGRSSRGRVAVSGDAQLRLESGAWQLEAAPRLASVPTRLRLRGQLDPDRPAGSTVAGTVAIRQTGIAALLDSLRVAGLADVAPDQQVEGIVEAEAALSGTLDNPQLQISAQASQLAAAGVENLAADLTAQGSVRQMTFNARVRQAAANVVLASGTVWPEEARVDATLTGTLNEPGLLVRDVPVGGVVQLQIDAAGPFDALTARGTVRVDDARYEEVLIGPLDATVDVDPAAARIAVTANEFGTRAMATVARDADRRAAIDVQVDDADLARVVRDARLPVPVSGRVSLRAHGEGTLDAWRQGSGEVEISTLEAIAGELPVRLTAPARVAYEGETLDVERLDAAVGETSVSVEGRLPVVAGAPAVAAADALRVTLVGDVAHAIDAVRATGLVEVPDIGTDGPVVLLARVAGSIDRPVLAADLEYGPGRFAFPAPPDASDAAAGGTPRPLPPVEGVQVRAHLENGAVDLLTASAEWQGARIAAEGRVPLRVLGEYLPAAVADAAAAAPGPAVLTARVEAITREVLAPFVSPDALDQIEGSIDASAQLSAASLRVEDLEGEVRLDRLDVRVADRPIQQRQPTRITFGDGFARVAAWDWVGQGATVAVQGQVRLADRQAALRAAGRLDLQMLTPFVRDAGLSTTGTLTPLVAVTGSLDDPVINAEVTLANGGLRLAAPRVIATGLSAKAVVSQLGAQITALGGLVNGGELSGGGQARFGGPEPWTAGLDFDIAGMALEFPEGLRSELDADLQLALANAGGTPGGTLSGTVTVLRSAYRDPIAVVTGVLAALRGERLTATVTAGDSLADRLSLDVRVVTDTDVIVDNNLAHLQLGGDLRVIGTAAAPALSGRVELREGGELLLGRNTYSIVSGTIDFENPLVVEPNLNVVANTRAGGEEIQLTLRGTPETLDPELESLTTPELGQADLASLLLTGRKLEDIPGSEGQIVGEQVVSYLSGDLFGVAGRAVGLDTIRFGGVEQTLRRDPAAIASETDPTTRMTFGKSLGNDLDITLSQSLRDADAQTWIVDYRVLPQLALRLVSRDDHLRGYEFRHEVTFGSPAPGARTVERPRPPAVEVTAVTFEGDPGLPENELRAALELVPGERFDFTEWQRDRDRLEERLHQRGRREARVDASRREEAAGVALSYAIDAGPPTAISVTGYRLPGDALDALDEAWTESVFDDFLEEEAAGIVRRALAEDGYLQPAVTAELTAGATKTLAIAIVPGERTRRRQIVITAADETMVRDLERWVRDGGTEDAAWREPASLERGLVTYLQGLGYLTATATIEAPRIENGTATLTAAVAPGPRFVVGDVGFTGTARVGVDALREAAALAPGAAYDATTVADARTRLLTRYRRDGFADARVLVTQTIDPAAARVNLVFGVEEGPQQVLRGVVVEGNRSIDTEVVERALDLDVGEPLGGDAWLQARSRLFDTALFRRVDVTTEPVEDAPPTAGERPVRVQAVVQEWPALRLRYGFQVSEERPEGEVEGRDLVPGFSADLTRRTFFGKALTTVAALQYQRRERSARVSASAPMLFGLPIESTVTAYRSREEFVSTTLLTDQTGVSWEQRVRFGGALRVSYGYAFDRDHTTDTNPSPDPNIPAFDDVVNIARLNTSTVFDTRDDPLDTTRGLFLSSSLDYSSDAIGSGVSFLSHLAQAYYFRPWRNVVFASAARLGLAAGLAGQALIPSERYFAGGARTVRGVPEEDLGPHDFLGATGGGGLLVLNQEVRFPIFGWLRGVGFVDAGNVFEAPSALSFTDVVGSVGAGLRLATPFALLRVDYGRVFTESAGGTGGRWTFGIGQAF